MGTESRLGRRRPYWQNLLESSYSSEAQAAAGATAQVPMRGEREVGAETACSCGCSWGGPSLYDLTQINYFDRLFVDSV